MSETNDQVTSCAIAQAHKIIVALDKISGGDLQLSVANKPFTVGGKKGMNRYCAAFSNVVIYCPDDFGPDSSLVGRTMFHESKDIVGATQAILSEIFDACEKGGHLTVMLRDKTPEGIEKLETKKVMLTGSLHKFFESGEATYTILLPKEEPLPPVKGSFFSRLRGRLPKEAVWEHG